MKNAFTLKLLAIMEGLPIVCKGRSKANPYDFFWHENGYHLLKKEEQMAMIFINFFCLATESFQKQFIFEFQNFNVSFWRKFL